MLERNPVFIIASSKHEVFSEMLLSHICNSSSYSHTMIVMTFFDINNYRKYQ